MKNLLLVILLSIPFFCWADTLDYWTVYYNDSILVKYNSNSKLEQFILKSDKINKNDSIFIVYGNDHPCGRCEYYFAVKDLHNGVKIHVKREKQHFIKVGFPLAKLKRFKLDNEFVFFLYEDTYIKERNSYLDLFYLKIE